VSTGEYDGADRKGSEIVMSADGKSRGAASTTGKPAGKFYEYW
jgi:hypothetical protein